MGHLQVQLSNQICYRGVPQPVNVRPNSFRTSEVPLIPIACNFRSNPRCHTLSNALDMSKKIALAVISLSNDLQKSSYILSNWYTVESFGVIPDCDGVIIWFAFK